MFPPFSAFSMSRSVASLPAAARSASSDLPDSTTGTTGGTEPSAAASPASGASSRITCTLEPLIPNEETPARRECPPRSHGTASVSSRTAPADQST